MENRPNVFMTTEQLEICLAESPNHFIYIRGPYSSLRSCLSKAAHVSWKALLSPTFFPVLCFVLASLPYLLMCLAMLYGLHISHKVLSAWEFKIFFLFDYNDRVFEQYKFDMLIWIIAAPSAQPVSRHFTGTLLTQEDSLPHVEL